MEIIRIDLPDHYFDLLGKIFYGAAFADGTITDKEIQTIETLIQSDWQDEQRILASFTHCLNLSYDVKQISRDIEAHKKTYPELFPSDLNRLIVQTAYRITNSYARTNKSEIVYISQITLALAAEV